MLTEKNAAKPPLHVLPKVYTPNTATKTNPNKNLHKMPKRTDIQKILLIGSGPIVIGQACEFDYSGTQAARSLKKEGYEVILVNSNPATIMTDPMTADRVYLRELTPKSIKAICEEERPDAVLPTMGGQTALNLARTLHHEGFWKKMNIEIIGVDIDAIDITEDRQQFRDLMEKIGVDQARSRVANLCARRRRPGCRR